MLRELNVLIVDDDNSTIESLSHLLNRLGAKSVTAARSGMEGFMLIRENRDRFDCVISDICMPEGNGLELLYQIRTATVARNFRPDMCVLLMSGLASATIAGLARRLDVNAFLVKPFTISKLQMAVISARRRSFPLNQRRYFEIGVDALQVA
jgi:CheY-like chemotaxis protein